MQEIISCRQLAQELGVSVHVSKEKSFAMIAGFVQFKQTSNRGNIYAKVYASQIQAFMRLGYLRTNQLLGEMVEIGLLRREWIGWGWAYKV